MNDTLLKELIEQYTALLEAEQAYRDQKDGVKRSLSERPTKTEIKRIGLMLRKETLKYEKEFDRNYWRFD